MDAGREEDGERNAEKAMPQQPNPSPQDVSIPEPGFVPRGNLNPARPLSRRRKRFLVVSGVTLLLLAALACRESLLLDAAGRGDTATVRVLLRLGTNVNTPGWNFFSDKTPLMQAAMTGQVQTVKILLAHRANVNVEDDWSDTPLSLASEEGNTDVIRLLLAHGANTRTQNGSGDTPLSLARQYHHEEVEALLRHALR